MFCSAETYTNCKEGGDLNAEYRGAPTPSLYLTIILDHVFKLKIITLVEKISASTVYPMIQT